MNEFELHEDIAKSLASEAKGEATVVANMRKAGLAEGSIRAVVGAMRLMQSTPELAPVAEAFTKAAAQPEQTTTPKPAPRPKRDVSPIEKLEKMYSLRAEARPELKKDLGIVELKKAHRRDMDRNAEGDLQKKADEIRKAERFKITKEQAIVRAYDEHPDLYARIRRDELRKAGVDVDQDLDPPSAGVPVALEKAADALQAVNPELSREQALLKACEAKPSLYKEWGESQ